MAIWLVLNVGDRRGCEGLFQSSSLSVKASGENVSMVFDAYISGEAA